MQPNHQAPRGNGPRMGTPRQAAEAYLQFNWKPIPLGTSGTKSGKAPAANRSSWKQTSSFAPDQFDDGKNIGLALGKASGGLVVLDFDTDVTRALAAVPDLLPVTWMDGRGGRFSHAYFQCPDAGKKVAFSLSAKTDDPNTMGVLGLGTAKSKALIELLAEGQYVMTWPSVHESGETVEWNRPKHMEDGPAVVPFAEVVKLGGLLSFLGAVVLAYPKVDGQRDEICMALTGTLLAAGYAPPRVDFMVETVARLAGDEEYHKRGTKADRTKVKLDADEEVTGMTTLCDLLAISGAIGTLQKWLPRTVNLPTSAVATAMQESGGWPGMTTQDGSPKRDHRNTVQALDGIQVRKNIFTCKPEIHTAEEGVLQVQSYAGDSMTDDTILLLADAIANAYDFDPGVEGTGRAVKTLAAKNPYHPVRDWLESLPTWDGEERLATHLVRHFGAVDDGIEVDELGTYVQFVSQLHVVAAVARIMEPGKKYDHVLILEGIGGAGKSSYVQMMAVRETWFNDQTFFGKKDEAQAEVIRGRWQVELPELVGITRTDPEEAKAAITRRSDNVRAAYGQFVEDNPRQCVFTGTTEEFSYLSVKGSNRRFLPVRVTVKLAFDALAAEIPQLYAEALHLYREGFSLFVPEAMMDIAAKHQAERVTKYEWEECLEGIEDLCSKETKHVDAATRLPVLRVRAVDVVQYIMGAVPGAFDRGDPYKITKEVMERRGWKKGRMKIDGTAAVGYEITLDQYKLELDNE